MATSSKYVVDPTTGTKYTGGTFDGRTYTAEEVAAQNGYRVPASAIPSATIPTVSAVQTSKPARVATNTNLKSLAVTEAALSPEQSANNLSQVYQGRTDLQGLYNPDGTAKNPNDPRVAGIPTLADWASKYGQGEEQLLKGFASSPAVNAMLVQINQGLSKTTRAGAPVGPGTKQKISDINNLTNDELSLTSAARTAADDEDYRSLDGYMKELADIRKNRNSLTAELLKNVQKSDEELKLSEQLGNLDQEARETKLSYKEAYGRANDKVIPMEMIRGQQETALRAANLQLERIATEQGPVINRLSLAQETRQNAVEALQVSIQAIDQDSDMVFRLASFAQELAKTEKAEREAARDFAFEHNISAPSYLIGGTVYKTDGTKTYSNQESYFTDFGVTSFDEAVQSGKLMVLEPGSENERALVTDMISKYPDAGIGIDDTLSSASAKLKNSRIYGDQVRGPQGPNSDTGVLGLSNQQIDNISPLVTQFQNSPIVQNYNTIGEGYKFANSLKDDTTNPADDQALIYALAKALDPGSVVREGEYATVQKYAQSLAQSYGKSVTQALSGTGFLSKDARTNIKATIQSRFKAAESTYKNLYGETSRRINLVGGTDKGDQLLNNYGGAFSQPSGPDFNGPVPPDQSSQPNNEPVQNFWGGVSNWLWGTE